MGEEPEREEGNKERSFRHRGKVAWIGGCASGLNRLDSGTGGVLESTP